MPVSNPILSFRRALKNSPWLVMSILAHVIVLVWLGLVVMQSGKKTDDTVEKTFLVSGKVREAPPPEIPQPERIDRTIVPDDQIVEVIDETMPIWMPTEVPIQPNDFSKDIGDPNSLDPLALPEASSSGAGTGEGASRGFGPTAHTYYGPAGPGGTDPF